MERSRSLSLKAIITVPVQKQNKLQGTWVMTVMMGSLSFKICKYGLKTKKNIYIYGGCAK